MDNLTHVFHHSQIRRTSPGEAAQYRTQPLDGPEHGGLQGGVNKGISLVVDERQVGSAQLEINMPNFEISPQIEKTLGIEWIQPWPYHGS